ncbi:gap junction delta-4 protein [Carlito syrichta]|uniref:Gap junction protein n=1 Tax=Carlito syrichta TaxID=1868482 RepID=A0A1U7T3E0_CARSF|nr:gap junction delta-4 protein [Carlito syrichta]
MENVDLLGFLVITLNCNVTIAGKIWLVLMILLRMAVVVLAGYPIYQDEQERFVCNTLQPGCTNVCYDIFSPVSQLRFWLIQSMSVLLPYAVFSVYVLHRGAVLALRRTCHSDRVPRGPDPSGLASGEECCPRPCRERCNLIVPDFSSGYIAQLLLRTLVEAAFGALHYLLFGFLVPKRFSCTRAPCTSVVDCYVSRPTEKSIMMLYLWVVSGLSFLLGVADLICSVWWRGTSRGVQSPSIRKEYGAGASLPGHTEGCQADEEGGWEEDRVPMPPGAWTRGEGTSSPRGHNSSNLGQMELPDEEESEVMSSASEKLARESRDRPHREAAQDPRSNRSEEWPSASRSRLAGPCSHSQLLPPGQPASSGSVPHLRTKKSEWV